jgi:S-adenosylmethionine synthetase
MARYIAKNVVAADLADVCEVQLSYAIGVAEPTSVHLDCQGTERVDADKLSAAIRGIFDLTPRGIIDSLGLRKPIYVPTSYHGHFGRTPEGDLFGWEKTDKVDALKSAVSSAAVGA